MTKHLTMLSCPNAKDCNQPVVLKETRLQTLVDSEHSRQTESTTDSVGVPQRMLLNESLRKNAKDLRQIPLIPLNCTFGVVKEKHPIPLKYALRKETKLGNGTRAKVSVVFVVRRPGCSSCREHGNQLTNLYLEDKSVAFWAIVKETGVEEQGILTFFSEYFHFPIFKDEKWLTYKAMGNRKLSPLKLIKGFLGNKGRWAKKGIENRLKGGDVFLQGGLLIFKGNKLRYAYEEDYGKELNISDIRAAVKALQEEDEDETASTEIETLESMMFL
ncbi:hypothetical protein MPSEU_000040100 [Mayamaea pseudoterrestris]|nr:hypothetical protein MPSEU_000040100 [Mayamaea pseudoterrestris]